ncbi:hypothetical protein [Cellulomonas composti]|uniref:Uncharacterized protein n=1 Tax=Cellulomonas composti TaxID=266130 RepID=A0A511J8F6_9CELL|nr:hypothetical protein [Cellulomonas composti]GEL94277.1 hypothetical protein CCO02nite_09350 [Cellulomonas composti]
MLSAALVPDTALLVPGVSGAASAAADLRAAALAAVRTAIRGSDERASDEPIAAEVDRTVVVVAPGDPRASACVRERSGVLRASLAPVGVPDGLLGRPVPVVVAGGALDDDQARTGPTEAVPAVATSVALHLLDEAGWTGGLRVIEIDGPPTGDGSDLRRLGAALVHDARQGAAPHGAFSGDAAAGQPVLVVVGSASGRHGPDAPLADDPRATGVDAAVLADLASGDDAARARLAGWDAAQAHALACTGWGPWQVLLGAVDAMRDGAPGLVVHADVRGEVVLGAAHVVGTWSTTAPVTEDGT